MQDYRNRLQHWIPFFCSAATFALNFWICHRLFFVDFSEHMESIEGAYITISRWAMAHWSDLSWFPLWYSGSPFRSVYQPGLHLTVAALASAAHMTPERAYHVLTACAYCAGPVTLFLLCWTMTRRWGFALISSLIFSLVSPICLVSSAFRADAEGWTSARRYQILVHYGEGPHTTALALIPLAVLALHNAVTLRRRVWIAIAPLTIAAVVLTNWPGTVGLTIAILAWCISRLGSWRRREWLKLAGIGVVAYLIACPWMPPSTLLAVFNNAQRSDATTLGALQLVDAVGMVALLYITNAPLAKRGFDPAFRFFAFFVVLVGVLTLGYVWFGWHLLPQPQRFQLEFDLASAAAIGWLVAGALRSLPRSWAAAVVAILLSLGVSQARVWRGYARRQTRQIKITSTIEYRMSRWFATNLPQQRVFAPGNVSFWMNMFNDEPQMGGCCDQGMPSNEYRYATYGIYAGRTAEDARRSTLWLQTYGANAIGTTGPDSTEVFKPFVNWREFDGVLPEIWREGDNAIFRVPRRSPDPVRVIPKSAIAPRAPANGADVEPIRPLVAALEDTSAPLADFRWTSTHEALVRATTRPGDVIFLQISASPGWRAMENGQPDTIHADPLGMMYVEPRSTGPHELHLIYDENAEEAVTRILRIIGLAAIVAIAITAVFSPSPIRSGPHI